MYWAVYIAYDSCSNLFNRNSHELCYSSEIQYNGIILVLQNGSFLLYKWLLHALNQAALKRADERSNISSSFSLSLPQKEGKEREGKGRRCGVKLWLSRLASAIQDIYSTHLTLGRSNYTCLIAKKEVRSFWGDFKWSRVYSIPLMDSNKVPRGLGSRFWTRRKNFGLEVCRIRLR